MTETYRWNVAEHAAGYDATAEHIHPHYVELQDHILAELGDETDRALLVVDLGGGSGRLAEKLLTRFPQARAVVVDQSRAFLALAAKRLEPFQGRGSCFVARLQADWSAALPVAPHAIVSTSAIHHLEPDEKRQIYQRCYNLLAPGGVLLNGDEVRPAADAEYLAQLQAWVAHMHRVVAAGLVTGPMIQVLANWEQRNVAGFGQPRNSGDDCHQTVDEQLAMLRDVGFEGVAKVWHQDLWALMKGTR